MNTMEVLTLLLVIFAALAYIDNHNDKKNKHPLPPKVYEDAISLIVFNRGQIGVISDYLSD